MPKKTICVFLFTFVMLFVSWQSLTLVKVKDRQHKPIMLTNEQKTKIKHETIGLAVNDIIDYSASYTAKELSFSRKVNCVTYANYGASICNYAFQVNGYEGCYAKPVVGYVSLFGFNLCDFLYSISGSTFVMNHDFTEITIHDDTILVDASLQDLIFNSCKRKL